MKAYWQRFMQTLGSINSVNWNESDGGYEISLYTLFITFTLYWINPHGSVMLLWNLTTRKLKRLNFTYGLQIIRNIAARCVNLLRSEGGKVKCRLTKHIIKLLSWNIVISLRVKKVMYLLQFVPYILSTKSLIKFDLRSPMIETACISRKVKSVRSYKTTFFIHSQT